MSRDPATPLSFPRAAAGIVSVAIECGLALALLAAMDALGHRRLTPAGFALLGAGWVIARAMAAAVRSRSGVKTWVADLIELLLPAVGVTLANPALKQPWTGPQVAYACGAIAALWQAWRWGVRRSGGGETAEAVRWFGLAAIAAGALLPFFTDRQLGGRDAAWYTSVFIDFLEQLRGGTFPVFIGQGELSYNGSANLFRSAPLCLWIGGVWDWLTWQSLSPVAIRNLAMITAAVAAVFSAYAALVGLANGSDAGRAHPERARWLAAVCAALYLLAPVNLLIAYTYELQMTFTALFALPWIFLGNVRALERPTGGGYVMLAVGLALAWLAHVPLAIIATLVTAALQLGRFALAPTMSVSDWRAAFGGAGWFALLSAYYFFGMSELPPTGEGSLPHEAAFMGGMILLIFCGIRAFHLHSWRWLGGVPIGLAAVAWGAPPWVGWAVAWLALEALIASGGRRRQRADAPGWAAWLVTGAMLAAALAAAYWAQRRGLVPDDLMVRELANERGAIAGLWRPLQENLYLYGNTQPGYAVLALIGVAVAGAWRRADLTGALLASLVVFLGVLAVPVPGVTDFVVGFAPVQVGHTINLPMLYRLLPVLMLLAIFAAYRRLLPWRGWAGAGRWWLGFALLAGLAWSLAQAVPILQAGFRLVASREATARAFSPDNFALGRYPYLMLFTPLHYMDGKVPPLLNSRLLTPHYDLLVGPEQLAREAEAIDRQEFPLTSTVDETAPQWLQLTPDWYVHPGETRLLRFEFDPAFNAAGWLIMSSRNGYQEYLLDRNFGGAGFGTGPIATHVVAVTNRSEHIEHYTLRMKMEPGNTLPRRGERWGRVIISRYYPERASIEVQALRPLRMRVVMSEHGFLETPRQWLPGYRASVDGRPVPPVQTGSGMLGVPVPAGTHDVELEFVGSARLWLGLATSGLAAAWLLGAFLWRACGGRPVRDARLAAWREAHRS